jgi:HAD superfamily hydrolase (TIGR01490 family)
METTTSGNSHSYTVFLDLDGTIISKISGKLLVLNAVRSGYAGAGDLVRMLIVYLLYRIRLINDENMANKLVSWSRGITEKELEELCNETCNNQLIPSVYKMALEEINSHKKSNARIVLLSASISQVCGKIAEEVKADDIICSALKVKDGYLTGEAEGILCYGQGKISGLREFCIRNDIQISESWYYGDSISDLPVFMAVGSPVCVNPGKKLRKIAIKNGWKILTWSY